MGLGEEGRGCIKKAEVTAWLTQRLGGPVGKQLALANPLNAQCVPFESKS